MSAVLKQRPTKRYVIQDVEMCIDEFSDDDLEAELLRRGKELPYGHSTSVEDLFNAMQFKNHAKALELLRLYLMDVTGRILP